MSHDHTLKARASDVKRARVDRQHSTSGANEHAFKVRAFNRCARRAAKADVLDQLADMWANPLDYPDLD